MLAAPLVRLGEVRFALRYCLTAPAWHGSKVVPLCFDSDASCGSASVGDPAIRDTLVSGEEAISEKLTDGADGRPGESRQSFLGPWAASWCLPGGTADLLSLALSPVPLSPAPLLP